MNVLDIKNRVQDYTGSLITDADAGARVLRFINDARVEIARKNNWNCLLKHYQMYIPADYTTGTVSVSASGQTVTGLGTAWTSADVGKYINLGSNSTGYEWYRITKVNSGTELLIDVKYVGTSALSGSAYTIRKIYHRIPGDAMKIGTLSEFTSPQMLLPAAGELWATQKADFNSVTGTPNTYGVCGLYGREDTYTTGTVSGTINTKTLTGNSTSWMTNLVPGDKIVVEGETYHVDSVDSDTQVTLYQKLVETLSTDTYVATSNPDSMLVRFYRPSDRIAVIPVEYHSFPFPFNQDQDEDALTRRYGEVVVDYCVAKEKRASDDSGWVTDQQQANLGLTEAKAENKKSAMWKPNMQKYSF